MQKYIEMVDDKIGVVYGIKRMNKSVIATSIAAAVLVSGVSSL